MPLVESCLSSSENHWDEQGKALSSLSAFSSPFVINTFLKSLLFLRSLHNLLLSAFQSHFFCTQHCKQIHTLTLAPDRREPPKPGWPSWGAALCVVWCWRVRFSSICLILQRTWLVSSIQPEGRMASEARRAASKPTKLQWPETCA